MRRQLLVSGLTGAALLTACGSSSAQLRDENNPGSGPQSAQGAAGTGRGGSDDFTRRDITEVKAPVYLEGIDRDAQDAFRDGVRAVSGARPDFGVAVTKFKAAAEKAPSFLEAFFNWGQALERLGKNDEALGVYQKALDKNPGNASASAYIAKVYLGKARTERLLGKNQEADQWLNKAKALLDPVVAQDATNVAANNALALYYLMKDDVDTAERYVKEVLYVEPINVTGLNTRGLINLKKGHLLLAKWIFENKVLREDPSSTEAHTNLGYTYIQLGQRPLAMREFQAAVESDPENMEARENIAAMLLEHLDYANAFDNYTKILEVQPNNQEAMSGRCDAMYGLGGTATDKPAQWKAAIDCYEALLKVRPDRTDLYKRIAETYQGKLQDLDKAVVAYERYGKLGKLNAEDADKNAKIVKTLKDIIASGGLKALETPPEEAPPETQPE